MPEEDTYWNRCVVRVKKENVSNEALAASFVISIIYHNKLFP